MTGEAQAAERSARRAARSRPVEVGARIGIAAYGLTHLLVAWLALQVAFGGDHGERADQTGAFQTIAEQPLGRVLLWGLVVGFAAVALWRLQEAIWGFAYEEDRTTTLRLRAVSAGKAVVFGVLAVLAARTAAGGRGGDRQSAAAGVLGLPGGQVIVAAVGVGIFVTGVVTVVSGLQARFRRAMVLPSDRRAREPAVRTGQIGFVAKGLAIGIIGVLVVIGAVLVRPDEASGLDAALRALAGQPFGPYLLVAIAVGLVAYGVFCFIDARYHRF
ncbi:DUF1206 domain-containing protein [Pseudonocardia adelaidensis]|uniref:DUF1206 domain-containing protein n=1 Tax=Pseudonocardia adelaidensis TaxID=648754 RepID=A0ABP9N7J9_9PSEU